MTAVVRPRRFTLFRVDHDIDSVSTRDSARDSAGDLPRDSARDVRLPMPITELLGDPDRRDRLGRRLTAWFHAELADGVITPGAVREIIDPEPLVIHGSAWPLVRSAIVGRVKSAASLVERLRSGKLDAVPGDLVDAWFGLAAQPSPWRFPQLPSAPVLWSVDMVLRNGRPVIVGEELDSPTGLGSALLIRSVMGRAFGDDMATVGVTAPAQHLTRVREAVAELAPSGRTTPRTVVLAPAVLDPTYSETAYLATRLGLHLVTAADLVVLQQRVRLRTLAGTESVDAIIRAVPEADMDPLSGATGGVRGVAALHLAWLHGTVGLANPDGLASMQQLATSTETRSTWNAAVDANTRPSLRLQTGSTVDGEWVIRFHIVKSGEQVHVLAGGVAEQRLASDPMLVTKRDVWVLAGAGSRAVAKGRVETRVDLGESVPTSAAEALFWAGVNAEQAETAARMARVLVRHTAEAEPDIRSRLLQVAAACSAAPQRTRVSEAVADLWLSGPSSVSGATRLLVANLQTARAFLSAATWGVAEDLLELVNQPADDVLEAADGADAAMRQLAAFSGLIEENTVRSPARTFLLIGRRLHRARRTAEALAISLKGIEELGAEQRPVLLEALLNTSESLIAYRRRYRSDVVLDQVLHLLVEDKTNPRSIAFQATELGVLLRELSRHARDPQHQATIDRVMAQSSGGSSLLNPSGSMELIVQSLSQLTSSMTDRWFSVDRLGPGFPLMSAMWKN
jgi:uncharacterized alpha-E superfamily protein